MMYAFNNCTFTKINLNKYPNHDYSIKGKWAGSNKKHEVIIKAPDLFKYHQGTHIQNCFPYLSCKDREFLKSGMWLEPLIEEEDDYEPTDDGSWEGR